MNPSILDFTVRDIEGKETALRQYAGKVLLIVNVASKCGFTSQYAGLQALHVKYRDRGLVVLGFPSNDFLHQEPGDEAEIKQFCTLTYGVEFPMFAKIRVWGEECAPLYRFLTDKASNPEFAGGIKWNFTKFLIGRDGTVVDRFSPTTGPSSAAVAAAIEKALAASPAT